MAFPGVLFQGAGDGGGIHARIDHSPGGHHQQAGAGGEVAAVHRVYVPQVTGTVCAENDFVCHEKT
uniref:hypothetical protein n=1 Tax=Lachnoclostridium phocaeense TaxID=1871021 RepID=UPI0026DD6456|nr:hypothetical protein [Lachnoclostridium phocaeense]